MSYVPNAKFGELLTPSRKLELIEDQLEEILSMIQTIGLELYTDERHGKGVNARINV